MTAFTPNQTTVLVDLDGDGVAEMVGLTGDSLIIYKGDGTGSFTTVASLPNPSGMGPVFRDMDKDGHLDMVVPGTIWYGKGNLAFDAVTLASTSGQNFAVGDFDGDGMPDIAIASGVLFGQGGRTFTSPTGVMPFGIGYAADIDGDGKDDIVLTDVYNNIEIYHSVGRAGFIHEQSIAVRTVQTGTIITSMAIADFNGDGVMDIAVGTLGPDDLFLYTRTPSGEYQVTSYAIGINGVAALAADFNHDGKPDIAFLNYGLDYKPPNGVVVLHK